MVLGEGEAATGQDVLLLQVLEFQDVDLTFDCRMEAPTVREEDQERLNLKSDIYCSTTFHPAGGRAPHNAPVS